LNDVQIVANVSLNDGGLIYDINQGLIVDDNPEAMQNVEVLDVPDKFYMLVVHDSGGNEISIDASANTNNNFSFALTSSVDVFQLVGDTVITIDWSTIDTSNETYKVFLIESVNNF